MPFQPPHKQHIPQPNPGISNTQPRLLIAYQPTSHHCTANKQTNNLRTTYTHSPPDHYLVEKESLYLF